MQARAFSGICGDDRDDDTRRWCAKDAPRTLSGYDSCVRDTRSPLHCDHDEWGLYDGNPPIPEIPSYRDERVQLCGLCVQRARASDACCSYGDARDSTRFRQCNDIRDSPSNDRYDRANYARAYEGLCRMALPKHDPILCDRDWRNDCTDRMADARDVNYLYDDGATRARDDDGAWG